MAGYITVSDAHTTQENPMFKTIEDKQRVLYNLALASNVLADVPAEKLDLYAWRKETPECGTLYCGAGHLTLHPYFAQFMALVPVHARGDKEDKPTEAALAEVREGQVQLVKWGHWDWLDNHFGPRAFSNCFAVRGEGRLDRLHPLALVDTDDAFDTHLFPKSYTDKDLILWRLTTQYQAVTHTGVQEP